MRNKCGRRSTSSTGFTPMNQTGSLLLLVILLLSFGLLISLPVLQLVVIEYQASINEQVSLQTHYLAEAGLARVQQMMRFNVDAPLPPGEQPLGNGTFSVRRVAGQKLVAVGRVGNATTSLSLKYEPQELSQGYLLCVGSADEAGQLSLHGPGLATIDGNALIVGDLAFVDSVEAPAVVDVHGELALTGEVLGTGTIEPAPVTKPNPLDGQLWAWLQSQLLQPGEPLPEPQAGRLVLQPGVTYECADADWEGISVIGPDEAEAAATVIVRGDMRWRDCRGNINLMIAGDCRQAPNRQGTLAVQGVVWVQGTLEASAVHIQGALVAASLQLGASGSDWSFSVAGFPWQSIGSGLVVPKFSAWNYFFD